MNYTANDIQTLDFRTAIRTRIAMYMGSADNQGVLQCVREIITNSIDEATMGYGNKIMIDLYEGNRIKISDQGRGCPFGIREDGTEALEAIFTMAHSGAKFDDKIFQNVAGMNGIGGKGVALSSDLFQVWSYRDGECATLYLKNGIKEKFEITKLTNGDTSRGTVVEFIPSQEVYNLEPIKFDFEEIKKMCQDWSYLSKGVSFILHNHITNEKITYLSKNGLIDLLTEKGGKIIHKTPLSITIEENGIEAEIVMGWTNNRNEVWHVFTNGLENSEGGTSLTGIKTALTNFFKKKLKGEAHPDVLRKGLFYAVSCKVPNPSFANQTKTKVNNPELRGLCQRATTQMLEEFEYKHNDEFTKILELLTKELKAEQAAERARRQVLEATKDIENEKKKRIVLADKLKDCKVHGSNNGSVLAITEGDSALGALVQARPIDTVALMPIRGKIISALKHEQDKILQNEEVKSIFSALGCGFFNKYNSNKLRYQYVAIAADQDPDGKNIGCLLITLFYYMCPQLIEEGRLLWIQMPLFVLKYKDKVLYAFSDYEKNQIIKQYGTPKELSRKKGIGENSPSETKEAVFGKQKRWWQLCPKNNDDFIKLINMLMGKDVSERKEYIMKNVDFSTISE